MKLIVYVFVLAIEYLNLPSCGRTFCIDHRHYLHYLQVDYLHYLQVDYLHYLQIDYLHYLQLDYLHYLQLDYLHSLQEKNVWHNIKC